MSHNSGSFYGDFLFELANRDHSITVMSPSLNDGFQGMRQEGRFRVLRVPTKPFIGDYSIWVKGIRILSLTKKYKKIYNKFLNSEKFDYVIMPTPPMALVDVMTHVMKKSGAKSYIILRDIHPECLQRKTISTEVLSRTDVYDECKRPYSVNPLISKILYRESRNLYKNGNYFGCMTPGNQKYIKGIAPYLDDSQILLLPNWYSLKKVSKLDNEQALREKYNLIGKTIAIFGGTIGEAQAIWNIAALAKHNMNKSDLVFLVVGRGSKFKTLQQIAQQDNISNLISLSYLPRQDYEAILQLADIGLISIDEKYTVPTSPSKILGYMAMAKPVLAIFNEGNDYGEFYIDSANCGLWVTNLNYKDYFKKFDKLYYDRDYRISLGRNGHRYFKDNFQVSKIVDAFESQIKNG